MKPGESDCSLCLKRPMTEGGNGACPYRGAMLSILQERKDCPKFVEGNFAPKKAMPQTEGLF